MTQKNTGKLGMEIQDEDLGQTRRVDDLSLDLEIQNFHTGTSYARRRRQLQQAVSDQGGLKDSAQTDSKEADPDLTDRIPVQKEPEKAPKEELGFTRRMRQLQEEKEAQYAAQQAALAEENAFRQLSYKEQRARIKEKKKQEKLARRQGRNPAGFTAAMAEAIVRQTRQKQKQAGRNRRQKQSENDKTQDSVLQKPQQASAQPIDKAQTKPSSVSETPADQTEEAELSALDQLRADRKKTGEPEPDQEEDQKPEEKPKVQKPKEDDELSIFATRKNRVLIEEPELEPEPEQEQKKSRWFVHKEKTISPKKQARLEARARKQSEARARAAARAAKPDKLTIWWEKTKKKYREKMAGKPYYGWIMTLCLCVSLVGMTVCFWALFVSGPARIHDEKEARATARMEEQVPGITGISETVFAYITYEGYTTDQLYWFDVTGELITQRDIKTLNYEAAKKKVLDTYGVETQTIQLAYGYTAPAYEIQGNNYYILLDYDTLNLVYERRDLP